MNINKAKEALAAVQRIAAAAREAGSDQLTRSQLEDFLTKERRVADEAGIDLSNPTAPDSAIERAGWLAEQVRAVERGQAFASHQGPRDDGPAGDLGADYDRAFEGYVRHGMASLSPDEQRVLQAGHQAVEARALGSIQGSQGGFTVPQGFWDEIVAAQQAFGGLLGAGIQRVETDSGNDIPVPTSDDTGNSGEFIGESELVGEQDIAFGQKMLKAFTVSSKVVRVPNQLLQDSAFDLDNFIGRTLGARIGRAIGPKLATGTGLEEPEGILNGITTGHTSTSTGTVSYADLVNLEGSVDAAYRANGEWVISDGAFKHLKAQTTTDGLPLYPSLSRGTLLEKPVTVDIGLGGATMTSSETPIIFGDLSYFVYRSVQGMVLMRLSERWADYNQTGFLAFARVDSKSIASDSPYKAMSIK